MFFIKRLPHTTSLSIKSAMFQQTKTKIESIYKSRLALKLQVSFPSSKRMWESFRIQDVECSINNEKQKERTERTQIIS